MTVEEMNKKINVFSDVKRFGLFLPYKKKYTKADFNKVHKRGFDAITARWIVLCSAAYYSIEKGLESWHSKFFNDTKTFYIMDMMKGGAA